VCQVTVLGDILESNLVCLPALEVWAGMLGDDATTTGSSVTAGHPPSGHMAAASSSSRPRSPADDSRPNLCGKVLYGLNGSVQYHEELRFMLLLLHTPSSVQ
jgi:hypothetical protein